MGDLGGERVGLVESSIFVETSMLSLGFGGCQHVLGPIRAEICSGHHGGERMACLDRSHPRRALRDEERREEVGISGVIGNSGVVA